MLSFEVQSSIEQIRPGTGANYVIRSINRCKNESTLLRSRGSLLRHWDISIDRLNPILVRKNKLLSENHYSQSLETRCEQSRRICSNWAQSIEMGSSLVQLHRVTVIRFILTLMLNDLLLVKDSHSALRVARNSLKFSHHHRSSNLQYAY